MLDSNKLDEEYIKKTLTSIIWNNEVFRWAIYEIKCNSDKGKILKEIFYLFYDSEIPELPLNTANTPFIISTLVEQGFDVDVIKQVILLLAHKELEN